MQHVAHAVDRGLVGGLLVAHADQRGRGQGGRLGDAHELEREVAIGQLTGDGGVHRRSLYHTLAGSPRPLREAAARPKPRAVRRSLRSSRDRGAAARRRRASQVRCAPPSRRRVALLRGSSEVPDRLRRGDADHLGPRGHARGRQPPRLADDRRTHAERSAELEAVRRRGRRRRDRGRRACSAWAAPRWPRRCCAAPSRTRADRPALHVLDSTDAGAIGAVQDAIDPERTLFLVSSKSGGTIEPQLAVRPLLRARRRRGQLRGHHRPGHEPAGAGRAPPLPRAFRRRPGHRRALQRAVAVRAGARGARRESTSRAAAGRRRRLGHGARDRRTGQHGNAAGVDAAVLAGRRPQRARAAGRDKLTFVIAPTLPGLGLWLEQLVAESTGKQGTRHPAGRRGAARRAGRLRRTTASSPTSPTAPSPQPTAQDADGSPGGGGTPGDHDPHRAGPPTSGACSCSPSWPSRSPAGACRSTPSTSPTCSRPRTPPSACWRASTRAASCRRSPTPTRPPCSSLLLGAEPPEYVALMAYVQPSREFDLAAAELREAVRAADARHHHLRLRAPLPALDRPVPQGRPEDRALPADAPRRPRRRSTIPGAPYTFTTLKNAQATGDLQTLRALGRPAERVRLTGDDPAGALRSLTATIKEGT